MSLAALEAQAHRTAPRMIKQGARCYAACLEYLSTTADLAYPAFPLYASRDDCKNHRLSVEGCVSLRLRWTGFGGEVPLLNFRSAMVYTRLMRRRDPRYLNIQGGAS